MRSLLELTRTSIDWTHALVAASVLACAAAAARAQQPDASGAALIERHRCGACHVDLPPPRAAPRLAARGPLAVLAGLQGAHPDFRLAEGEALALALSVGDTTERGSATRRLADVRRRHPRATAELGRSFARGLNCGGCHAGLPSQSGTGPVLAAVVAGSRPEWLRRYLRAPYALRPFGTRPGSGARMPDFHLDQAAADSIVSFLRARAARMPSQEPTAQPLTRHSAATADALLDVLSCRGCHQAGGRGGRIGPSLDDVLTRRTPDYIARIVREPEQAAPWSAMPRNRDARLLRVIALLAGGAPHESAAHAGAAQTPGYLSPLDHPLLDPDPGSAPAQYGLRCAACHGARGNGNGYNARYLGARPAVHASDSAMRVRPDDTLFDGIAAGGTSLGRSAEMPAFGAALSPSEIRALVRYIRALCDCVGPAWAREPIP